MATKKSANGGKTAGSKPRLPDRVVVPLLAAVLEGKLTKRDAGNRVGMDDQAIRRWLAHDPTAAKVRSYLAGKFLAEVPMPGKGDEAPTVPLSDADRIRELEEENQQLRDIIIDLTKRMLVSGSEENPVEALGALRSRQEATATVLEDLVAKVNVLLKRSRS